MKLENAEKSLSFVQKDNFFLALKHLQYHYKMANITENMHGSFHTHKFHFAQQ